MTAAERIRAFLGRLYDAKTASRVADRIITRYPAAEPAVDGPRFNGSDSILITYADSVREPEERPLITLGRFVAAHLPEVSHIHLLPFFPSSGDGGFAVTDYYRVDPTLGTWDDVTALTQQRRLMVDLVVNHVSIESEWFRRFLEGDPEYRRWFHTLPPDTDVSDVFRPRTHPLLTTFATATGPVAVWTTFSNEQADLNFAHPPVFEEMIRVLMSYVARGASVIRLDAVAYMWKEVGTPCLHHPNTHTVVKLLRAVLDHAAPHVALVTETNVPHVDNIAYFGCGDEAQMVYNFSLPPLVLDAFLRQDTSVLTSWAAGLDRPPQGTFLNFLASHDGIGLTPVNGLLPSEAIDEMARKVEESGGLWSGRTTADGSVRPYELNIGFLDALGAADDEPMTASARFLTAVSIQMSLQGVPGVYIHSALGTPSWWEGPRRTGIDRSINRPKLNLEEVSKELVDPGSRRSVVLAGHRALLAARRRSRAFDPSGEQVVHNSGEKVFSLTRSSHGAEAWCVTNVSAEAVEVKPPAGWTGRRHCLLDGATEEGAARLPPYGYHWFVR